MTTDPQVITIRQSDQPRVIFLERAGVYRIELIEDGAAVDIRGGWHLRDHETLNTHVTVVHAARHTRSNTLLRAVVDGQARAVVSGTIVVQKGAQHTNAFLTENVLLLSPTAQAQALPNLEIEANEVKCSHAATVSRIPEEHVFYLQSRGIERAHAEQLIVDGFLAATLPASSRPGLEEHFSKRSS